MCVVTLGDEAGEVVCTVVVDESLTLRDDGDLVEREGKDGILSTVLKIVASSRRAL